MDILTKLLTNVLPLYAFIGAGYVASRWWGLKSKFISKALLYVFIPVVIFDNLLQAELTQLLVVAAIVFLLAVLMNLPAWVAHRFFGKDLNKYLLFCSYSYFNIGWFGIPVVLALFGEEKMPLVISAYMGNVFYGDTIGYYLMSRSKDVPVKAAIINVLKIPAIYACVAAVIANSLDFEMPETLAPVMEGMGWVLSALGMVMIGIGLTKADFKKMNFAMFGKVIGFRYVSAALLMGALVLAEMWAFGQLEGDDQKLLLLFSTFPIAANLVVFASYLDSETENAALLVSLTSVISLVLVPVLCLLFFQ